MDERPCGTQRAFALLAVVTMGCAGATPTPTPLATEGLANPELDAPVAGAGHWWMSDATPAAIDAKLAEGYRLFRLDVTFTGKMTALFVNGREPFAFEGVGWRTGLTAAEVDRMAADPARRIVDLSLYVPQDEPPNEPRYAVVWRSNGGASKAKRWRLITAAASVAEIERQAEAGGWRVIDLEVVGLASGRRNAAVMIENAGVDRRRQRLGQGSVADLSKAVLDVESSPDAARRFPTRVVALDHVDADQFAWVIEERTRDEEPWWFVDLELHGIAGAPPGSSDHIADPASLSQIDNLGTLTTRLGGRIIELKRYQVEERLAGLMGVLKVNEGSRIVALDASGREVQPKPKAETKLKGETKPVGKTVLGPAVGRGGVGEGTAVGGGIIGGAVMRTRYLAILTDAGPHPQRGPAAGDDATLRAIDETVQWTMKKYGLPGAALAITKGGKLVYAQGYGHSHLVFGDARQPRPATADTMFRLASVSKTLTALGILQLIERGAKAPLSGKPLTLDTHPFGEIFPGPIKDPALARTTIRELLEHRTFLAEGLEVEPTRWGTHEAPVVNVDRGNARSRYQNQNYHLLTRVIERVSGGSYESYFARHVLEPVGARRLRISQRRSDIFRASDPQEAAPYDGVTPHARVFWNGKYGHWQFAGPRAQDGIRDHGLFGSGAWTGSPIDLLRVFCAADGSLPGPRLLRAFTPFELAEKTERGQAAAGFWFGQTRGGVRVLSHGGWLLDSVMSKVILRDDGIKIAFAFNGDNVSGGRMRSERGRALPERGGAKEFLHGRLEDLVNDMPLPDQDLWPQFGFAAASR